MVYIDESYSATKIKSNSGLGHHNIDAKYITVIYNITHSLVTWSIVFWALWLIYKKPIKASYARLLHILIDIPTHSLAFFATPFLRPLSNYKFDGVPRSNKMIFIPNIIILIVLYSFYLYKKFYKAKKTKIVWIWIDKY